MKNEDIRNEVKAAGLKLWQIGDAAFGITDSQFSRKLRRELESDDKEKIRKVIIELKEAS